MNARGPFGPATLPAFQVNQFGGNFGGPISKEPEFLLRQLRGDTAGHVVEPARVRPQRAFRQRVLAVSPELAPIINAYPAGDTPVTLDMDSLRPVLHNTFREDSGMFRFDQHFTDNTTLFVRYNIDDLLKETPGVMGNRGRLTIRPSNLVLQFLHIFSPTVINEAKAGMNRSAYRNGNVGVTPVTVREPPAPSVRDSASPT